MPDPIQMTDILTGVYNHLKGNSTFNTALGGDASTAGRIWMTKAEPNATLPYAIVYPIDAVKFNTFDQDGTDWRIQVSVWADEDDSTVATLTGIVDDLIDRMQRTSSISITNHDIATPCFDVIRGPVEDDQTFRVDVDFILNVMRQ